MDSEITSFCSDVLEFRRRTLTVDRLQRLASHLRDVVQPQLVERETLLARVAALEAERAKLQPVRK